jgi:hypothetical protein
VLEPASGEIIMKKIIGAMLFLVASASHAGHLEVISFTLNDDCSMAKYLEIVNDFNAWAETRGYQTEIAVPHFSDDQETLYWMGRSANAEVFGKANDEWVGALGNAGSVPAQLMARFNECGAGIDTRRAYRILP